MELAFLKAEKEEHEDTKDMKNPIDGGRRFSALSYLVIDCAIEVHRELGPGLRETTYRQCFTRELALKGVQFEVEAPIANGGLDALGPLHVLRIFMLFLSGS